MSHKSTPFDAFDETHQVILDRIIDNMASSVQSGKYGAINRTDTVANGFYITMITSEAYTLQDNTTIDGQIIFFWKISCQNTISLFYERNH